MKRDEDSLISPPLEELLLRVPQKYELVLAATRRAKQIIRELRLNPLGVDDARRGRKPLTLALLDIVEDRVDTKSLVAPDIEFDDLEEEQAEMFPELEGFSRRTEPEEGELEGELDSEEEDSEDSDDLDELDDIEFGLTEENEDE